MNDIKIKDIEVYMQALGTLKKGEKAVVKVLRGVEEMVLEVQL